MDRSDTGTKDQSLAAAAVRGDRAALQALWEQHRRWIAAVLLAYKPASADVQDLLQEVAMALVAKIGTLRDENNVRAWLRTVAVNAARAAARSERARPLVHIAGGELDRQAAAARPAGGEAADGILDLLRLLPDGYREPLMLKAVQGLRTRQIAHTLGINEAAVDTRISRARRMLRELAAAADGAGADPQLVCHSEEISST